MSETLTQPKILIVDDSADTIRLLSGLLQEAYQVVVASGGGPVLEEVLTHAPLPDLILLDVLMPGVDGYEVCRRLKANPATRGIPVIFSTSLDDEQDEARGFAAGAVDYVNKPFKPAILKARIKTHLDLKYRRESLEERVKARTAELEQANCKKEEALRAKSEFLSCVTHELRTPMSGVIGISDLLLSRAVDDECRDLLAIIRSSATAQMRLIDDILDFARLEHGQGRTRAGEVHVQGIVKTVCDMFLPEIHEKGLSVEQELHPDILSTLRGDERLLSQVLMNLVGNAVKFTWEGRIVIRGSREARAGQQWLRFEVTDTGIGIAEEKRALIFEGFAQADSSSTRSYPGLGLGLGASKRMVELMGGKIGVESVEGQGARFWFTVPIGCYPGSD